MGLSCARISSVGTGTCCGHSEPTCIPMTGQIIKGAGAVFINGLACARIGDVVLGDCGHSGVMIKGSGTVYAEGLAISRISDAFDGTFFGTIIAGSNDMFVGG